ncbi:unnamed protein product [Phytophthora lilii]|uniref:Unnamed protein product n=1 Tax=Phytophthora lilii TaxID=2077276 RepID=A0A9W7DAS2_9STRA|nr:unnamed protein product [Phytophthora lilii]
MTLITRSGFVSLISLMLATLSQAGFVELYRDANFQHKLRTVQNVIPDRCYRLACGALNNVVTSAQWGDLPTYGKMLSTGESVTAFYTGYDCSDLPTHWYQVAAQSSSSMHFPSNFTKDNILNISSFMVMDTGKVLSHWNLCTIEAGTVDTPNKRTGSMLTDGDT